jgi:hypothetical protein
MKLFSTKKRVQISEEIDSIRRNKNAQEFDKWRKISEIVIKDLSRKGQFFDTQQGQFFFDGDLLRTLPLHKDVALSAIIAQRYGINPKEYGFDIVLSNLQSEAYLSEKKIDLRRFAHYDPTKNQLYVSQFNGSMFRLNGDAILSVPNGTDDVYFFDDSILWQPFTYLRNTLGGEFDKQLIESVNFTNSDLSTSEQQLFLKIWVHAIFFGNVQPTKIILLLLGEQGSGKTSALRRIQKLIFGPKVNLLSIEKDKQDGFIATITTDPVALFDNLDEQIHWLSYALSRLATGVTFSRRRLYTTNDKVEFPGVSRLGITARSVRFMEKQPDLPDRTLVLKVGRLLENRPEQDLLDAVAERRNTIWPELLDGLNAIVGYLRDHPEPVPVTFRMADFAAFALKVAALWGRRKELEKALAKLEGAQAELVLESEPIHQVLALWLQNSTNHGREMEAGLLHKELSKLAGENQITWPFGNGRALGIALGQAKTALREKLDFDINWDAHGKQNRYSFRLKQSEVSPDKAIGETQAAAVPEEVPEFAGCAGCKPRL